jgi:hypothetical protein
MEHTQIVNATELESYAERKDRNCQAVIPEMVCLLVNQSVPDLTACRIPYGDSINQPGWDGLVETASGFRQFVPRGKSFWEIGTGANPQEKATEDFRKRTDQMTAEERQEASYIAVTPYGPGSGGWIQPAQSEWIKRRNDEGWHTIKILDAIQLADWLREFPAIGRWLLKKIGLVKSAAGFRTPTEHWDDLHQPCAPGDPSLPPKVFLLGREQACKEVDKLFRGQTTQLVFTIQSELDAEDFVAAFLASLDDETRRLFSNKCLFVKDPDVWLSMVTLKTAHVLVAHPYLDLESSGEQLHLTAKNRGHAVIIPVSGGSTGRTDNLIPLRSPSAFSLETALVEGGFSRDRARELASAGTLSLAALKRHLRGLGAIPPYTNWDSTRELALAGLLGRWAGENPADRIAVEKILGKSYGEWIETVRRETLRLDTPLTQRNENWKIISRGEAWLALGPRLTNDDLDRFHNAVLMVLGERDPKLELPPDERITASWHGKVLQHSSSLRQGVAETLALLGSRPSALSSCSQDKPEVVGLLTVRELLKKSDWITWASLDSLLPLLAEAAPKEFLDAVEASLLVPTESPFKEIFAQEGRGLMGSNYMTGLLWALETLAWHPDHLVRVTVLLAELASIDPGGNWGNRPANSLVDIFLPWHPQTCASILKRKAAIEAILREQPAVGWKLLMALMPSMHGFTTGTRKPTWREFIPTDWSEGVTNRDYWDQVSGYAEFAATTAATNPSMLAELIDRLPDLPPPAHQRVLEHLSSAAVVDLPESERRPLWEALVDLAAKHRRFADAQWAMPPEVVAKIEEVAAQLAPKLASEIHRRLFSERDFDLFEEKGNYEEQERNLNLRRQEAVKDILREGQLIGVLDFARQVASPEMVGQALGCLQSESADAFLLPEFLGAGEKDLAAFIFGFVRGRFWTTGWGWVDAVVRATWTAEQKSIFLAQLPFAQEAWRRAEQLLGDDVALYWKGANVNPWGPQEHTLEAVGKLLQYGRPRAALSCLHRLVHKKASFPTDVAVRALLDTVTGGQIAGELDRYAAMELIKWLQENPNTDQDDLFRIECAYLPLLDHEHGGVPITLERRLADDPGFFCELVASVFRSDKDERTHQQPTETERNVGQFAYRLLRAWKTVPGCAADGSFDGAAFANWLAEVKERTSDSGHFRIAMSQLGQMLPYAPPDPDGLWIHRAVAEALNAKEAGELRSGFTCGLFNMRSAHFTSRTGQEELEIAATNREKADSLEQKGFHRFATAIRELADSYERDAKREASRDLDEY